MKLRNVTETRDRNGNVQFSAGRVVSTYQVLGIAIQFNGPAGALESVISAPGTTVPNSTSSTQIGVGKTH